MRNPNILIACEESQAVCIEFRKLGANAFSCDIEPCTGGVPGWHLLGDVLNYMDSPATLKWDAIIAFPPCTHLAVSGAHLFAQKRADGRQQAAIKFFMKFAQSNCKHVCIENPVGIMSTHWRKPDQIIEPYMFGHPVTKKTCLWLKGLPKLVPTNLVTPEPPVSYGTKGRKMQKWMNDARSLKGKERSAVRSKTFQGIAEAMATQWYPVLMKELHNEQGSRTRTR